MAALAVGIITLAFPVACPDVAVASVRVGSDAWHNLLSRFEDLTVHDFVNQLEEAKERRLQMVSSASEAGNVELTTTGNLAPDLQAVVV